MYSQHFSSPMWWKSDLGSHLLLKAISFSASFPITRRNPFLHVLLVNNGVSGREVVNCRPHSSTLPPPPLPTTIIPHHLPPPDQKFYKTQIKSGPYRNISDQKAQGIQKFSKIRSGWLIIKEIHVLHVSLRWSAWKWLKEPKQKSSQILLYLFFWRYSKKTFFLHVNGCRGHILTKDTQWHAPRTPQKSSFFDWKRPKECRKGTFIKE